MVLNGSCEVVISGNKMAKVVATIPQATIVTRICTTVLLYLSDTDYTILCTILSLQWGQHGQDLFF